MFCFQWSVLKGTVWLNSGHIAATHTDTKTYTLTHLTHPTSFLICSTNGCSLRCGFTVIIGQNFKTAESFNLSSAELVWHDMHEIARAALLSLSPIKFMLKCIKKTQVNEWQIKCSCHGREDKLIIKTLSCNAASVYIDSILSITKGKAQLFLQFWNTRNFERFIKKKQTIHWYFSKSMLPWGYSPSPGRGVSASSQALTFNAPEYATHNSCWSPGYIYLLP